MKDSDVQAARRPRLLHRRGADEVAPRRFRGCGGALRAAGRRCRSRPWRRNCGCSPRPMPPHLPSSKADLPVAAGSSRCGRGPDALRRQPARLCGHLSWIAKTSSRRWCESRDVTVLRSLDHSPRTGIAGISLRALLFPSGLHFRGGIHVRSSGRKQRLVEPQMS